MTTRTIELPAPRELKMTLTEALKARKTIRSFTTEPISDADLSTLLWCTAGITRPDGKRTVPSCLDLRTVSVCVLRADGAWRWNASKNTLRTSDPRRPSRSVNDGTARFCRYGPCNTRLCR